MTVHYEFDLKAEHELEELDALPSALVRAKPNATLRIWKVVKTKTSIVTHTTRHLCFEGKLDEFTIFAEWSDFQEAWEIFNRQSELRTS